METIPYVPRAVLVANQKGGVGKSSIVAGVASMVASGGKRVLVVDADPQGNVSKSDFGQAGDQGRGLAQTLHYSVPLTPLRDVRPDGLEAALGVGETGLQRAAQQQVVAA